MGSNLSDSDMTARALGRGAESVMLRQAQRIAELEAALRGVLEQWEPTRDDYSSDKNGNAQFADACRVWSDAHAAVAGEASRNGSTERISKVQSDPRHLR